METFGEWLRGQRTARNLTREEFSKRVGCSVAMLRKIENDERRPSAQIAGLIANALELPASERETFIRVARGELGPARLPRGSNLIQYVKISPTQTSARSNFPILPTPLVGRQHELTELHHMLDQSECRLLTLVGPGGMGKTRLAIEVAAQMLDRFEDGVYFVPLASVSSTSYIIPVIADSIGFAFQSASPIDPKIQLLNYLEEKHVLLLVDNIEHLLQETGVELLAELLSYAPHVKLVITSREPVNLQGEWIFEVQGLPLPENEVLEGTSVELFLQRARRTDIRFNITTSDYPAILRICSLLNGMPLGIELAAAWVRTLSCEEIAGEIEHGMDFLSVNSRDLPSRHRSMRAVFDHSWRLLSSEEQLVLSRLSRFQGGFSRNAAEHVAGAALPTLSSLVMKSLIRRTDEGRYDLHELIRQYAADQLAGQSSLQREIQECHARYYMEYFRDQDVHLRSSAQQKTIEDLSLEMDNFRLAWSWAITTHEFDLIESTLRTLETFFDVRGWLHEGLDYLNRALNALEQSNKKHPLAFGHLLAAQSLLLFRLAQIDLAREKLEQSIEILGPLNQPHALEEAVIFLGIVYAMTGRYMDALRLSKEGLALAKTANDQWFEALSLTEIVSMEIMAGQEENAYERLQSALSAWRATGDPRFTAFGLNSLSLSAARIGRFDEARAALQESITINQSVGDRWGLGITYRGLGLLEQVQGRHAAAIQAFQESQSILADLGARWDEARVLGDMGRSIFVQGNNEAAEEIWRRAIYLAVESSGTPLVLESITGIAQVQAKQGNLERAYGFLQTVLTHPATVQETKHRAEMLQAKLETQLTPERSNALQQNKKTVEQLVTELLDSI